MVVVLCTFSLSKPIDAAGQNPLAMVFYGWHNSTVDQRIVNAKPGILIGNTPAGYWHGNTNSAFFQSKGISVFSYITANYDQHSLSQNYSLIDAIAAEGTRGVFVDQASPSATTYNSQLCSYAHSKGLLVMLNPGMPYINANMYSIADYVVTDEHYQGRAPAAVELPRLSQTIVIGFGNWTAQQAAYYTNLAWSKGFAYSWHEQTEYTVLPPWLEEYVSLLSPPSTTASPALPQSGTTSAGNVVGTVASVPVPSGGQNEYNLNIKVSSTTLSNLTPGQQVWVAASLNDFPNLLTVGSSVSAVLDKSLGWWVMKPASTPAQVVNQAPVLAPIGSRSTVAGQKIEFNISATDPNGDSLTYSVAGLPTGATFSNSRFSWTPPQQGTFNVAFSVTDGKLSDSETVTITVNPSVTTLPLKGNTSGIVVSTPSASGAKNEYNLSLQITATTVAGLAVGQTVWLAARSTDFPNLLVLGSTLSGNLDKSLGWWVLKAAL